MLYIDNSWGGREGFAEVTGSYCYYSVSVVGGGGFSSMMLNDVILDGDY